MLPLIVLVLFAVMGVCGIVGALYGYIVIRGKHCKRYDSYPDSIEAPPPQMTRKSTIVHPIMGVIQDGNHDNEDGSNTSRTLHLQND